MISYEIHITVDSTDLDHEAFKEACSYLGVKPVLIDNQNTSGETVMLDALTSSVIRAHGHGDGDVDAVEMAWRIADNMKMHGFEIIREKVETVPWHPKAPTDANPGMPKNCYFEAHLNVAVNDETVERLRSMVGFHFSRNAFKELADEEYIMMATVRSYDTTYESFSRECENRVEMLKKAGFLVPKIITEFAIYDTNIGHDEQWMTDA